MLTRTSRSLFKSSAGVPPRLARTGIAVSTPLQHARTISSSNSVPHRASLAVNQRTVPLHRTLRSSPASRKGISPESEEPLPPNPEPHGAAAAGGAVRGPTDLTDAQYHAVSEHYLNVLLVELEKGQEDGSEVEAEYSVS
jgi:hypothetical protein